MVKFAINGITSRYGDISQQQIYKHFVLFILHQIDG